VKNTIRSQQRKLREEMTRIVSQKTVQSAYPALSRQDRRIAEHHHSRVQQEKSLQKDTKKAERLAERLAQIVEQLLKDFTKIKAFLGNYNFANTIGKDSDCSGDCSADLSTAIDTRQAWKKELENMLTMVYHYVDAQHLGDYSLLHQPETPPVDPTCNSSTAPVNCCPKVYRPFFHYYTPDGDCLGMAPQAGGHSGDSSAVTSETTSYAGTAKENFNGQTGSNLINYRGCILGYKEGSVSPAAEGAKGAPATHKHFQVTNTDLEIRQLFRLIAQDAKTQYEAWWSFLVANTKHARDHHSVTDVPGLVSHFQNTICLPATMIDILKDETYNDVNTVAYDSVFEVLWKMITVPQNSPKATKTSAPSIDDTFADKGTRDSTASESGAFHESLKHAPTICNVEDEADLQFIIRLVVCMTENIRAVQINNDREVAVIEYVREVSENNEAYHCDVFSELTAIDESELNQRYAVGKELCAELDALYKETCCTKQNFFKC